MDKSEITTHLMEKYKVGEKKADEVASAFLSFEYPIPGRKPTNLEKMFVECDNGVDAYTFVSYLEKHFRVNRKFAIEIARSIRGKAAFQRILANSKELRIKNASWIFRSLCHAHDREVHKTLNGARFSLTKGIKADGKTLFPGFEWGCECDARVMIPGCDEPLPLLARVRRKIRSIFSRKNEQPDLKLTIELKSVSKKASSDKNPT